MSNRKRITRINKVRINVEEYIASQIAKQKREAYVYSEIIKRIMNEHSCNWEQAKLIHKARQAQEKANHMQRKADVLWSLVRNEINLLNS